jgi:peptide methionine sulfoxide reductase msrA/msrB
MILKTLSLTPSILHIVKDKGTEQSFSGEYDTFSGAGTYLCRQCGLALFRSETKFPSGCGWPTFDAEIPSTVTRKIEILCARCGAHLGHIFEGENYTPKNTRHCINSLSLDFVPNTTVMDTEEGIFAGGCFWGVEYYFQQLPGVLKTESGYIGGHSENPTYHDIHSSKTGHCEAVRVLYDPTQMNYEKIVKYFFEIHDPSILNRPEEYKSAIFYYNEEQKQIALKLIAELEKMGYSITTELIPVKTFWRAELSQQNYYAKKGVPAECHRYEKKFK